MNISAHIIKCLNNERFVSRKNDNFGILSYGVKRIWFRERFNVEADKNNVYELTTKSGRKIEGNILATGEDEFGFFIVFRMLIWKLAGKELSLSEKRIERGDTVIREVFAPEDIKGAKDILKKFKGYWPYYHRSILSIEREGNNISLEFREGALGDTAIKLFLNNIKSESYVGEECANLEYFSGGKINEVDIRMLEDNTFKIIISNNYIDYVRESDNITEEFAGESIIKAEEDTIPEFIEFADEIAMEHHNEGIIECNNIEVCCYNLFEKALKDKNIIFTQLFNGAVEDFSLAESLRKRWLEEFAKDVDTRDIYIEQFLWHLFSNERVEVAEGEKAKDELKAVKKESIYIFLNEGSIAYHLKNAENFLLEDIRFYQDVYVVNEDFTWTFVSTHEDGWFGPYFYMKGKI